MSVIASSRKVLLIAVAVAAGTVGSLAGWLSSTDAAEPQTSEPALTPAGSQEAAILDMSAARVLAENAGGHRFVAAPGRGEAAGKICVAEQAVVTDPDSSPPPTTTVACNDPSALAKYGTAFFYPEGDGSVTVALYVEGSYATARVGDGPEVPLQGGFVVLGVKPGENAVVAEGPSGMLRVLLPPHLATP